MSGRNLFLHGHNNVRDNCNIAAKMNYVRKNPIKKIGSDKLSNSGA